LRQRNQVSHLRARRSRDTLSNQIFQFMHHRPSDSTGFRPLGLMTSAGPASD
jgi:hypothetical protein